MSTRANDPSPPPMLTSGVSTTTIDCRSPGASAPVNQPLARRSGALVDSYSHALVRVSPACRVDGPPGAGCPANRSRYGRSGVGQRQSADRFGKRRGTAGLTPLGPVAGTRDPTDDGGVGGDEHVELVGDQQTLAGIGGRRGRVRLGPGLPPTATDLTPAAHLNDLEKRHPGQPCQSTPDFHIKIAKLRLSIA